ncbi:MAG: TM0106 family RecB-like putative nuclease [Acidobacteriota bacterium]
MIDPGLVRASDLYELSECAHRIALDRRLPRDRRAIVDEGTAALLARGLALEKSVAGALNYPQPEHEVFDLEAGAAATLAMMRRGLPGIYQAVLKAERYLAIPDLIERVDGASALGDFHYIPGDIKAGLTPRADQVMQVAFGGWLLGQIQGRQPEIGFLILGDGRRERIELSAVERVLENARATVCRIVDGEQPTSAFYEPHCGRCRWRQECLPALLSEQHLSLVDGMTPARAGLLSNIGVSSVGSLAAVDAAEKQATHALPFGLQRLALQARALHERRIASSRPPRLPDGLAHGWSIHLERNPFDAERTIALAWSRVDGSSRTVRVMLDAQQRRAAFADLLDSISADATPLAYFGNTVARGLESLAEEFSLSPDRQRSMTLRRVDARPLLRSGSVWLPVRRYVLEEVEAAIRQQPLPDPASAETPAFVWATRAQEGEPGPWAERIADQTTTQLARVETIVRWLCSSHQAPTPRPDR